MFIRNIRLAAGSLGLACILGFASSAKASFSLAVTLPSSGFTQTNPVATSSGTTVISVPVPGGGSISVQLTVNSSIGSKLDIQQLSITRIGAGVAENFSVTINSSSISYNNGTGTFTVGSGGNSGPVTMTNTTGNVGLPAPGTVLNPSLTTFGTTSPFNITGANPRFIQEKFDLVTTPGFYSFNSVSVATVDVITPAPASALFAVLGLPAFGLLRRRLLAA